MEVPSLKRCIQTLILENVDSQCTKLCVKTKGVPSVLRSSREEQKNLTSFTWMQILNEMKDRAPDVLEFLATIAVPNLKDDGRQVAPLCVAYGVLMNQRCKELSLIQKINSILLGTGSATKKVIFIINNLQLPLQFVFVSFFYNSFYLLYIAHYLH